MTMDALRICRQSPDDFMELLQARMVQLEIEEADTAEILQRGLNLSTYFINRCICMGMEKMLDGFGFGG